MHMTYTLKGCSNCMFDEHGNTVPPHTHPETCPEYTGGLIDAMEKALWQEVLGGRASIEQPVL